MTYEFINDQGEKEGYGPYTKKSRFSDRELLGLHSNMVKAHYPEMYERIKHDEEVIHAIGWGIDLDDRYEALLEELPQSSFSKAGTHPMWVANSVAENTFSKAEVQEAIVAAMMDESLEPEDQLMQVVDELELNAEELQEEYRYALDCWNSFQYDEPKE